MVGMIPTAVFIILPLSKGGDRSDPTLDLRLFADLQTDIHGDGTCYLNSLNTFTLSTSLGAEALLSRVRDRAGNEGLRLRSGAKAKELIRRRVCEARSLRKRCVHILKTFPCKLIDRRHTSAGI